MEKGYYTARIKSWDLQFMGRDSKPCAVVDFVLQTAEGQEEMRWKGWLTEKSKQYTVRDLITLGFSDTTLERFARGIEGNALDVSRDYKVRIDSEEYQGKSYWRVKGIYSAKSQKEQQLDPIARAGAIKGIDIAAEVLAARGTGASTTVQAVSQGDDHDLPF